MDFPNSTITSNNSQDKDLLAQSSQINEDARNDSSIQQGSKIIQLKASYFLTLMKEQKQTRSHIDDINKQVLIIHSLKERVRKCQKIFKKQKSVKYDIEQIIQDHYLSKNLARNTHRQAKRKIGKIRVVDSQVMPLPLSLLKSKNKRNHSDFVHTFGQKHTKDVDSQCSSNTSIKKRHMQSINKYSLFYSPQNNNNRQEIREVHQHCQRHQEKREQKHSHNHNHKHNHKHKCGDTHRNSRQKKSDRNEKQKISMIKQKQRKKQKLRRHTEKQYDQSNQLEQQYELKRLQRLRKDFQKIIEQQNSYNYSRSISRSQHNHRHNYDRNGKLKRNQASTNNIYYQRSNHVGRNNNNVKCSSPTIKRNKHQCTSSSHHYSQSSSINDREDSDSQRHLRNLNKNKSRQKDKVSRKINSNRTTKIPQAQNLYFVRQ